MTRRIAAFAVLAMTSVLASVVLAAPANASGDESAFVSLVNRERTSRGLNALQVASDLVAVARRHSARMASQGRIYHNPNLGSEVSDWEEVGENVGRGRSVSKIHAAFMDSPAHRANILERGDNRIGVGVVQGSDGRIYVTQIFVRRNVSVQRSSSSSSSSTRWSPAPAAAPQPVAPKPPAPKPETVAVDVLLRMVEFD